MCYNCGCAIPDDNMGYQDNIIEDTLKGMADKKGMQVPVLKQELANSLRENITDKDPDFSQMFNKASKAWGQPIDEAKKNTLDLLTQQGN